MISGAIIKNICTRVTQVRLYRITSINGNKFQLILSSQLPNFKNAVKQQSFPMVTGEAIFILIKIIVTSCSTFSKTGDCRHQLMKGTIYFDSLF